MIVNKCKDCKYRDRELLDRRDANPIYSCRLTHREVWPIDDACDKFVTNTIVSTKREKQG